MPHRLNCRGIVLDLTARTHVMGILNVTPDSFSDGGKFLEPARAIEQGIRMAEEGADIIDIGGESTRPGSDPISPQQELDRILPVVEALVKEVKVPLSVDTYKSEVARQALQAGAHLVNDISAMRFDPRMPEVVRKLDVPVVLMHIKGTPKNMQVNPHYDDLIGEITQYLDDAIEQARAAGVPKENLVIDPGIGFGKRVEHNFEILRRLGEFKSLGCPILIGPSRKSFIGVALNLPVEERLEGTAAAVALGIAHGAAIVRVHDVKAMVRVARIADLIVGKRTLG